MVGPLYRLLRFGAPKSSDLFDHAHVVILRQKLISVLDAFTWFVQACLHDVL